ncbi:GPI-anchored surface protein, putative, partial [Bodo saltans]
MLALLVRQGDPGNSVHMSSSTIISDLDESDAVLRLLAEAMSSVIELPKQRNASGIVGSLLLGASLNASGRMYGDAPLIPVASTGDGSFASSTNEFVVAAREFVTKHFRRPGASTDGQATAAANHNSNSQQHQQRTFVDPINPGVVFAVVAEFNGPML